MVKNNEEHGYTAKEKKENSLEKLRKKNKTLIAISILLAGIATGSFFIDIAQLFMQKGFSARALYDAQVVEYNDKTWVRYDDPKIVVDVFDADDCEDCMTDEVLVRLRSLIPTLEAHRIDVRTDEGEKYAKENNIKYIPAFLFSDKILESDFYQGAAILFADAQNEKYYFDAINIGVPIGEYLESPPTDAGIIIGNPQATITLAVYTDVISNTGSKLDSILAQLREEYGNNIKIVFKIVPNMEIKNNTEIGIAALCANEQGKFIAYLAKLSDEYKKITVSDHVDTLLVRYARDTKLNMDEFTQCMTKKEYRKKLDENAKEASLFGVTIFPTVFVNGHPHVGVISYDALKEDIESTIVTENDDLSEKDI